MTGLALVKGQINVDYHLEWPFSAGDVFKKQMAGSDIIQIQSTNVTLKGVATVTMNV